MKRKWKALASLCLALAMMLCLSLPVWAEGKTAITESSTGSITVTGIKEPEDTEVTVSVYQLMTVNVDATSDQPKDPVYTWVGPVATWLKGENNNYKDYIDATDNSVTSAFQMPDKDDAENYETQTAKIAAFYDALAAAIRGGTIELSATKSVTVPGEGVEESQEASGTISDLAMGNYLVLIEGGMNVYRPSAVNLVPVWQEGQPGKWVMSDAKVALKSSPATITKTVTDNEIENDTPDKWAQVAIGDTVTYTLVADLPHFPENAINKGYQISDILPAGVSLKKDTVKVYGVNDGGAETQLGAVDYELKTENAARPTGVTTTPDMEAVTLAITFKNITSLYTANAYKQIKVTYDATVTSSIAVKASEDDSLTNNVNTAYLDYNNNPYEKPAEGETLSWQSDSDTATVYTYGIRVDKKSGEADENAKFLPGAQFELTNNSAPSNKIQFVEEKAGTGVYHVAGAGESNPTTTLTVGQSDENTGKLTIKGLDVGTYTLTETKAPDGYVILKDPIKIIIEDNGILNNQDNKAPNGKTEYKETTAEGTTESENASGYVSLEVLNYHGFSLPTTGGMGTVLFTAAGIALMGVGLAALVLFLRRRSDK